MTSVVIERSPWEPLSIPRDGSFLEELQYYGFSILCSCPSPSRLSRTHPTRVFQQDVFTSEDLQKGLDYGSERHWIEIDNTTVFLTDDGFAEM
jgi:hypothetical protein